MSQAALNNREPAAKISRRSNGGQLVGILFLLMVLGTVAWGGWMIISWMEDPERLPLSRLVVTGERHYTTNDDIRQAIVALGTPGTFMTQDVNIIQRQIERLPWIQKASVRKQWPDELKIHVTEYMPVARWNDVEMIDPVGRPFSLPESRTARLTLPLLYGPEGSGAEVLEAYRAIAQQLATAGFKVKSVTMSERRSWQVILQNDLRLELGRFNREERLRRFMQIYPILVQQGKASNQQVNYIDLRYTVGVAVGWVSAPIAPLTDTVGVVVH